MAKSKLIASVKEILDEEIIRICEQKNNELLAFLHDFQQVNDELIESFETTNEFEQNIFLISKGYQHNKIARLNAFYETKGDTFYSLDLDTLRFKMKKNLNQFPKFKRKEQSKERFHTRTGDKWYLKTGKSFKLFFYKLSILPLLLLNVFRKLFKKEAKKIPYWKYHIPYRDLVAYHTENILSDHVHDIIFDFAAKNIQTVKSAINKEEKINKILIDNSLNGKGQHLNTKEIKIDLTHESAALSEHLESVKREIDSALRNCDKRIKNSSQIAGTFEYPRLYLKYQNRSRKKEVIRKKFESSNRGWGNTLFGLLEDWKIDQEIYNLNYFSKSKLDYVITDYRENNAKVIDLLNENKAGIARLNDELFDSLSHTRSNHAQIIDKSIGTFRETIDIDIFEKASDKLIEHNLPERINLFELKINNFLQEISTKRWLTKLTAYDKPFKSSDLDSFSPRELISFEYLPKLKESCSSLKSKVVHHVDSLQSEIANIENVIVFNLSSVIESIEKGECEVKDIPKLTREGMERSQNKINEIIHSILSFQDTLIKNLDKIVDEFNKSTITLTVNENAFNLRMIVMKAKALKRSEEVGIKMWNRVQFYSKATRRYTKFYLVKVEKLLLPWKKRIGLDSAGPEIATELSDFLLEAYQKINNLPIIYQRLYKINPLTEMSFFTGRKAELDQLLVAYNSWKQGKYAPTVIIGEKWSGHTTLINYFIQKYLDKNNIVYENRLVNIHHESDFLDAWSKILNEKNIQSVNEIIEIIIKKYKGKAIIIENVQNYYLRTINGFNNLNLLIKLISKTYKDVFWLFSANIYAWNYLNKTIELSGYFGYQIQMNPFSDDELKELIMKKNNISGYKIIFMPADKNKGNKKFIKFNDEEKQTFLRSQFFNDLNDFAKGNISLALTYWLLSTRNITEDTIEINNFDLPDFSFVGKLNAEKVFIMYLLIMHDGLTLEHLGEVYKKPLDKLYLIIVMLLDDGILIERNNWYEVNPLIYRQSINMLKAKNLIY